MLKLLNVQNGKETIDHLSLASKAKSRCPMSACIGSVISTETGAKKLRPVLETENHAKEFIQQFYESLEEMNSENHLKRWEEVESQIKTTGTYDLTLEELLFGAKLAWRNVPRCIGRIQWNKLKIFDMRHISSTKEMFDAICYHMKWATQGGKIKIAITVFPNRKPGFGDFKIWNGQIVSYAGYSNGDGTFTGDPRNVEFTELCSKLGWKSKKTNFDILPLLLSANGEDPVMYEVPEECALRIPITHPKYPKLDDLKLEWYASPAISSMMFDCGGVEFPAAPFNGWYIGTEIGCRNFADTYRYNLLEVIAQKIGLDTKNPTTLWKDQALVEINFAVLNSFQKHGVTIMDHHTATETFMRHFETENKVRGGCPADWVWLVPPMSGSLTPVFHQEMAMYFLRPCYEYQEPAWRTHRWTNTKYRAIFGANVQSDKIQSMRKITFKIVSLLVQTAVKLFRKQLLKRVGVTILYATETGKSAAFANSVHEMFSLLFNPQIFAMDRYNFDQIGNEKFVIVVASTFGNGDAPENGETFLQNLQKMKTLQRKSNINGSYRRSSVFDSTLNEIVPLDKSMCNSDSGLSLGSDAGLISDENNTDILTLKHVTFSVFALGSSAYPNYCAFGSNVDKLLGEVGAERLINVTCGDELDGQEECFQTWSVDILIEACQKFDVDYDCLLMNGVQKSLTTRKSSKKMYRKIAATKVKATNELSRLHRHEVNDCKIVEKRELFENTENYASMRVVLKIPSGHSAMDYQAGDHIGIFPKNREAEWTYIYDRLINTPKLNEAFAVEFNCEGEWEMYEKLPKCSLKEMLTTFIDISTPCRQELLVYLASCTDDEKEKEILLLLSKDKKEYEKWKQWYCPTLALVLKQFPCVKPDAITLIAQLPLMQPRFYSVSSSPLQYPDEIHLTLGVLKYRTKNGEGPIHYGVCSNYLNEIPIGTSVSCFFRSTPSFRLPNDLSVPVILIGTGTGIAPLRGLWQERNCSKLNNNNSTFGPMSLYFGCRNAQTILYQDELFEMTSNNNLTEVYVAMSREKFVMKTYVQDLLIQNRKEIVQQIVNEGAHIYICGNCIMAEEVLLTIKSLIIMVTGLSENDAEEYITFLKNQKRYHVDIFGSSHKNGITGIENPALFSLLDNNNFLTEQ